MRTLIVLSLLLMIPFHSFGGTKPNYIVVIPLNHKSKTKRKSKYFTDFTEEQQKLIKSLRVRPINLKHPDLRTVEEKRKEQREDLEKEIAFIKLRRMIIRGEI